MVRVSLKSVGGWVRSAVWRSATLSHLSHLLQGVVWAARSAPRASALNHLTAVLLDCALGVLFTHYAFASLTPQLLTDTTMSIIDEGVVLLRSLLQFLMGSPAGLKLNTHLNRFLGKFFIYNVNLWWVFLDLCQPLLSFAFHALRWLGFLGITTHIAIIADLIAIASFHAYCIYVYAARFCSLQLRALIYVWRLFLGKKWNPQKHCVEHFEYPPSQLFVGVLLFTVLIYSLPTTAIYYVFFTTIRLFFFVLSGILTRVCFYIRAFPLLIFALWCCSHRYVCTEVVMTLKESSKSKEYEVQLAPSRASFCEAVHRANAKCPCPQPPAAEWLKNLKNVVTVKLF